MNFLNWIERMREKPVKSRRLAAFAISLSVTGLLFVIWLSFLLPDFFQTQAIAEKNQTLETPPSSVFDNLESTWEALTSQVGVLKSTVGAAVTGVNLSSAVEYKATSTPALAPTN